MSTQNLYFEQKYEKYQNFNKKIFQFLGVKFSIYSRLSLSRIPRDSLKYFEISVLRHIRFAELRKNQFD